MRIGVDGACWTNTRGYGRFLREIVAALAQLDQNNSYVIFLDSRKAASELWPAPFEARLVETSAAADVAAGSGGRRSIPDLLRMGRAVARERLDLFFFPTVYSYFPLWRRTPMLLGIHDTMAARNPDLAFDTPWNSMLWRAKDRLALAQSNAILTVSEYSRRSIVEHYGLPPESVYVVHEAAAPVFKPAVVDARQDFVLYAGGISPNKNLGALIRAFELSQAKSEETRLKIAGGHQADAFKSSYHELRTQLADSPVRDRVDFLGHVSDLELVRLYQQARVFVMPSLDEGFGLPAVEAMACGAPVIVSRGHALEEVTGGAGLTADPARADQFADRIDQVLGNDQVARDLSRKSLARAEQFSWTRAARELLGVFEAAAKLV